VVGEYLRHKKTVREVFYNRVRRHAKINNQIPAEFAHQFYTRHQTAA
jgi:transposase InsO family protein